MAVGGLIGKVVGFLYDSLGTGIQSGATIATNPGGQLNNFNTALQVAAAGASLTAEFSNNPEVILKAQEANFAATVSQAAVLADDLNNPNSSTSTIVGDFVGLASDAVALFGSAYSNNAIGRIALGIGIDGIVFQNRQGIAQALDAKYPGIGDSLLKAEDSILDLKDLLLKAFEPSILNPPPASTDTPVTPTQPVDTTTPPADVSTLPASVTPTPPANVGFNGDQIRFESYSPSISPAGLAATGTATVVPGQTTFPNLSALNIGSSTALGTQVGGNLTFNGENIFFLYPVSEGGTTFPDVAFDGVVLTDLSSDAKTITGVSLQNTNIAGITSSDVTFDAHSISINFAGATFPTTEPSSLQLTTSFANQTGVTP